jgi:8-oxo-dGTP pyrophosphatase MutT (NUDIX family)
MSWSPSVTVAAVIREDDRYLVVEERPDGDTVINQPAGHIEFGETLEQAVKREVLEETGRHFTPTGLIGIYQWTVPDTNHTYLRFCFCGQVSEPVPGRKLDPDINATHWMTLKQIVSGQPPLRSPLVLRCVEDARRGPAIGLEALRALV